MTTPTNPPPDTLTDLLTQARDHTHRLAAIVARLHTDDVLDTHVASPNYDSEIPSRHHPLPYDGRPNQARRDLTRALHRVYDAHQALGRLDAVPSHWWHPDGHDEAARVARRPSAALLRAEMLDAALAVAQVAARQGWLSPIDAMFARRACAHTAAAVAVACGSIGHARRQLDQAAAIGVRLRADRA